MNTSTNFLPEAPTPRPSGLLLILAFTAVYIIWGTTYLANRFGLLGMPPFILSTLRYGLAAIGLFTWCGIRKLPMPGRKNIRVFAISGLLMLVGGSGLVVTGEQYINSGATAVIIATEPILFLLGDRKNRKAYSPQTLIGLVLGFAGIFLFSHYTGSGDAVPATNRLDILKGTVLVLISTVFWVAGTLYARKASIDSAASTSPIASAAIQHLAGFLACLLIATVKGDWKGFHPTLVPAAAWTGLIYLVVMGTFVAFTAYMWLMKVQPPAIVSTHTYINPIVAVFAGWIFAGESIGIPQLLALALVLLGVVLVQSPRRADSSRRRFPSRRLPRCEAGS